MFCFCLQSSLLKLQAMDVDGGPSLGPSPEEGCTPPLGGKEQRSPCGGGGGLGGPGGQHHHGAKEGPPPAVALCHGYPADENSPPELFNRPPQSPKTLSPKTHQPLAPLSCYPLMQPLAGDGEHPQSPRPVAYAPLWASLGGGGGGGGAGGDGGGEGGGGVGGGLVHLLAGGHSPLPSPRCSALSLRFSSDPDDAPSPPCNQPYMLSRGLDRAEGSEVTAPPSIPLLTRHIQALKRKVRKFEEHFEQEMNYKPSYNDKSANPEIIRAMTELAKARKQLKELKLRQSIFELKDQEAGDATGQHHTDVCRYGASQQGAPELQQHTPTLEETVESLFKRLREKRQGLGMPENVKEMTQAQMVVEKMILQKCLLYFESVHGRAGSKQPDSLVKSLYDRYQMIKRLLCASPTFTIIEEEEGSDDDYAVSYEAVPPPQRVTRPAANEEDSDHDGDPAFVSPIDEVKAVRQQQAFNMANLHEASRSELLQCLRETRSEKKRSRKVLREFEEQFQRQTGRICQKEDRSPMAAEYQEYKHLKAKLRLLEVLLTKQEVTKSSPNRK